MAYGQQQLHSWQRRTVHKLDAQAQRQDSARLPGGRPTGTPAGLRRQPQLTTVRRDSAPGGWPGS